MLIRGVLRFYGRKLICFERFRSIFPSPYFLPVGGNEKLNRARIKQTSRQESYLIVCFRFSFVPFRNTQINSEPLRDHIKGKWIQVVDKTTKCLNRLLELGFSRRRQKAAATATALER
uniref:Uncharacterized protein n=1 Tax=Cacopsylla melanoneura TaxID=428564 RepID=A0A8D8LVD2_9HEMI